MVESQQNQKKVRLDDLSCSNKTNKKLSQCIKNLKYEVEIDPNLETLQLQGVCKLSFKVVDQFEYLFVHMKNLDIQSVKIFANDEVQETDCQLN